MSKQNLVIIGQSPAAFAAIRTLRAAAPDWGITLISTDGQLPYDRTLLPALINRSLREKDVFCAPEAFYPDNGVEVILDKELSRVNFNRQKLYLADRIQLDYDALLLTDTPQVRLPEINGFRRQGVFHFARLETVRRMLRHLVFVETAVVIPSSARGVEMALALKAAGKDVVVVLSQEELIRGLGDTDLRVIQNNMVEDILGEGEVQAVRFKSGKVMACEMVLMEDVLPDMRFFQGTELLVGKRITVHTNMRSSIENVYAADAVMELLVPEFTGSYSMDRDQVIRQGECAAKAIAGADENDRAGCDPAASEAGTTELAGASS